MKDHMTRFLSRVLVLLMVYLHRRVLYIIIGAMIPHAAAWGLFISCPDIPRRAYMSGS